MPRFRTVFLSIFILLKATASYAETNLSNHSIIMLNIDDTINNKVIISQDSANKPNDTIANTKDGCNNQNNPESDLLYVCATNKDDLSAQIITANYSH